MDRQVSRPNMPAVVVVAAVAMMAASTAGAIDRDQVIANAKSYAEHKWTMKSVNQTASCSASYKSDYTPGTYTGVCYDWGGYKTLAEFDADLAKGQGAGSHSKHGVLSCTTGVDCSGYVSKCWEAGHYGTSTIHQISDVISKSDVKKGDIFNKAGSHVVLFSHYGQSGAPIFYEASGSASKVRLNSSGGWSYVNGYTPRRYRNITDGGTAAVCPAPKIINTFPFADTADTEASACDTFDSYSCSPSSREGGPEVVYQVEIAKAGTLTASVTVGPGVDIDIHLLSSPSASACLARNDKKISLHVNPGTYFLAADTFVSSGGVEYAGVFTLDVSFAADAPPPAGGTAVGMVFEDQGNGDTSKAIAGATVTVLETGAKATTGTNGAFSVNLAAGTYTLKGSATGYSDNQRSCTVSAGGSATCSIGLKKVTAPPADAVIQIPSFPYTDTRDTKNSTRKQFNSYSCQPATGQKGGEYVYSFTLAEAGTMTATITDGAGVDIDIHLLSALDANSCLKRHDTTITADLQPGTYYLVADTYSNASGTASPGQYTLNVSFVPKPAQASYIEIKSFPYSDSRDTKNSTQKQFNSYSCSPTTGEKGAEFVYTFTVASAGKFTASVSDGTGVDIDIHLLSALDANACVARHDTSISVDIQAGTYFLVADTFSNSSGVSQPGQYTLTANFTPAGQTPPNQDKGTSIGTMWNTYYYVANEASYTGTDDTALYDASCKEITKVPAAYSDSVCIEGTGKLADGRMINYASTCSCGRKCPTGGTICYSVLDVTKYPWGIGASNRALKPLRSWAVDKSLIAIGTVLYSPDWDGISIPAADGIGGFVHDGCFVADDVGGAIKGNHYDFFAGTKGMATALEKIRPTKSNVTVYKNPGRCAHLGL